MGLFLCLVALPFVSSSLGVSRKARKKTTRRPKPTPTAVSPQPETLHHSFSDAGSTWDDFFDFSISNIGNDRGNTYMGMASLKNEKVSQSKSS